MKGYKPLKFIPPKTVQSDSSSTQRLLYQTHAACREALPLPREEKTTLETKASEIFASEHAFEILIAEDNLVNQQVILHILGRLGYQPDIVENGLQVIEQLQGKRCDFEDIGCRRRSDEPAAFGTHARKCYDPYNW